MLEINKIYNENCLNTMKKMPIVNNKNYIGSEISKNYCEISQNKIKLIKGD